MARDPYFRSVEPDWQVAVTLGMVQGARGVSVIGHAGNVQSANTPHDIWDTPTLRPFLYSPVAFEILSSSASDTAAGTGARTVVVTTLDGSFNEVTQVVTLNGTTPVALTGTHIRVNFMIVLTVGTAATNVATSGINVGDITVRVSGGGSTQGFIGADIGIMRNGFFTVPAAKTFIATNLLINVNRAAASGGTASMPFFAVDAVGARVLAQNNTIAELGPLQLTIPAGFSLPEKTTFGFYIASVSNNGMEIIANQTGLLLDNKNLTPTP